MQNRKKFYIDGAWVDPASRRRPGASIRRPRSRCTKIALGSKADVDKAVAAARKAFETFSRHDARSSASSCWSKHHRRLQDARQGHRRGHLRRDGRAAPVAERAQAGAGLGHLDATLEVLKDYQFEEKARHADRSCASRSAWSA